MIRVIFTLGDEWWRWHSTLNPLRRDQRGARHIARLRSTMEQSKAPSVLAAAAVLTQYLLIDKHYFPKFGELPR